MKSDGEAKKDSSVFDRDPDLFDRVRPDYPKEVYSTIVKHTALQQGARLLEIGCGTGKSTIWFAERGYQITAVEKGVNLSAFTAKRFSDMSNVEVINRPFEHLEQRGEKYDLIYAGTAFHWLDQNIAYRKCSRLLKDSGHIALFWSDHLITPETRKNIDLVETAYEKFLPEWAARYKVHDPAIDNAIREKAIRDSGFFERPRRYDFYFSVKSNSRDYVSFLSTTSDHGSLDANIRDSLFEEIARIIDTKCQGIFTKDYRTTLFLARKAT